MMTKVEGSNVLAVIDSGCCFNSILVYVFIVPSFGEGHVCDFVIVLRLFSSSGPIISGGLNTVLVKCPSLLDMYKCAMSSLSVLNDP
jgi:hypothetical protein